MATVKDEIIALRNSAAMALPKAVFRLEDVPEQPKPGTLVIRLGRTGSTRSLTALYRESERLFELIYFGETNIDTLDQVSVLENRITEQTKIAINGADYLTVGAFSMSAVLRTEQDVPFVICVLEAMSYSTRKVTDSPLIAAVETTIETKE